jgi:hypothetical protein
MAFKIDRNRSDKLPESLVLEELRKAAKHFGYRKFTWKEFNDVAVNCKGATVLRAFGSWENALKAIGAELRSRNVRRQDSIPEKELFKEMDRVWKLVGQRPSRDQWEQSNPKCAYGTYYKRFNGWLNACASFIQYKSKSENPTSESVNSNRLHTPKATSVDASPQSEANRTIPLKLRLQVLKRDHF